MLNMISSVTRAESQLETDSNADNNIERQRTQKRQVCATKFTAPKSTSKLSNHKFITSAADPNGHMSNPNDCFPSRRRNPWCSLYIHDSLLRMLVYLSFVVIVVVLVVAIVLLVVFAFWLLSLLSSERLVSDWRAHLC